MALVRPSKTIVFDNNNLFYKIDTLIELCSTLVGKEWMRAVIVAMPTPLASHMNKLQLFSTFYSFNLLAHKPSISFKC